MRRRQEARNIISICVKSISKTDDPIVAVLLSKCMFFTMKLLLAARGKALYLVVVLKFFPYREIHEAQNSISNAIHTNTLYVVTTTNAISTILAIVSK